MITVTYVPREGEPDKAVVDGVEFKANAPFELPEGRRELADKLATNASFKVKADPPVYPTTEPGAAPPAEQKAEPAQDYVYDDSDDDDDDDLSPTKTGKKKGKK